MFRSMRKYLLDCSANTAIIFALGALPLSLAVGAAVDYSRAVQVQQVYQSAADAAALAAVSRTKMSDDEVKKLVSDYLKANGALDIKGSTYDVVFSDKDGKVSVKVNGDVATSLMNLAGIPSMSVNGYSEVEIGSNAMEMVLVLDNTFSMSAENRINDLRDASQALIKEVFKNASGRTDVKMGIVPFAQYVNVGMGNRNKSWIDVPADYEEEREYSDTTVTGRTYEPCTTVTRTGTNDGVPVSWTENVCPIKDPGTEVTVMKKAKVKLEWRGCVGSRSDALDTRIDSLSTKHIGLLDDPWNWKPRAECPSPITELTSDDKKLSKEIDAMTTVGETYIPAGLQWGWNVIDPSQPFEFVPTKNKNKVRAILLMTDGKNSKEADYPWHNKGGRAAADKKSATLCENIKADGIRIYTVAFKVDEPDSLKMLTECASDAQSAFDADNKADLIAAFTDIAKSLAAIHIAK
jgi:Flp pilus assembly protein TadG